MKQPRTFPHWLLTPLLLLNLSLFSAQLGWAWFSRQKALTYSSFVLLAVISSFLAGVETLNRSAQLEALPTPMIFEGSTNNTLVNRTKAASIYAALLGFTQANPPATQLSLITADLALWLGKPAEASLLQNSAQLADKFVNCYSIFSTQGHFSLKCEKPE